MSRPWSPTLVDWHGRFRGPDDIITCLDQIWLDELRIELAAPVEAFLKTGVPSSHLDFHHHMLAVYTPLFAVPRELAQKYEGGGGSSRSGNYGNYLKKWRANVSTGRTASVRGTGSVPSWRVLRGQSVRCHHRGQ